MAQVEMRNLRKTYGDDTVVDDVSLRISDGEFVVMLGPSGCGKTTTLRIVAGLEHPTSGELYFDDLPISSEPPIRRNVGMVFQNYALYPHMTVADNLAFGLQSQRREGSRREAKTSIRRRVEETAALLEISHVLDHRPKQLSGGQKQRVALGRALIRKPAVFLMDEPLSNLDANLRDRVRMELANLREAFPVTTIYVTHDQGEALTLAHRVVVMNKGRVCQVATPADVYDTPADSFVARFIGAPGMNLWTLPWTRAAGEVLLGGAVRLSGGFAPLLAATGDKVTVGIRPEHLVLERDLPLAGALLDLRVEAVEHLGSHLLAHGRLAVVPGAGASAPAGSPHGGEPEADAVVARLDARLRLNRGDHLRLAATSDRVHLFDASTGARVAGQVPVPMPVTA